MTAQASWQEQANGFDLVCGPLSARLVGDQLRELAWQENSLEGQTLALRTPVGDLPDAFETYTRGGDLVSTHAATDAFPFRTQLQWSAELLTAGGVQVTLTASLQTDLLDTQPELCFATNLPGATSVSAWQGEAVRFDGLGETTLVVTPHPSDAIECEPQVDGTTGTVSLSPPFLEKGVIRRCRLAAIWLPGAADDTTIAAAIERFANTPLPLTA